MHACGHVPCDNRAGPAEILSERTEELTGVLKLVFQPAEKGSVEVKPLQPPVFWMMWTASSELTSEWAFHRGPFHPRLRVSCALRNSMFDTREKPLMREAPQMKGRMPFLQPAPPLLPSQGSHRTRMAYRVNVDISRPAASTLSC